MPTYPVSTTLLPVNQIRPNPDQPRKNFDPEELKDLKESIQERGLINPISVMQISKPAAEGEEGGTDGFMIIAGERRYRAVCELGWTMIDARIWPSTIRTQEVELMSLVENIQRADLTPIEVAAGFKILTLPPHNMTQEQLGQRLGKTKANINQYIALVGLDPEVKEKLNRFNLKLAHLLQICRLKAQEEQVAMAQEASEKELSVKELKTLVDKSLGKNAAKQPGVQPNAVQETIDQCHFRYDGKVVAIKPRAFRFGEESPRDWAADIQTSLTQFITGLSAVKK